MSRLPAAVRERRRAALARATLAGVWTLDGTDECAVLCADCDVPMLILRLREESGRPVYCIPCGSRRFRPRPALATGARVRFVREVERYPHFVVLEGELGTVTVCDAEMVAVRMDEPHDGAQEWANECIWAADMDNRDDVATDLEVIR